MNEKIKYEDLKCEFCDGLGGREKNIDGMDCPVICSFCDGTGIDLDQLEKLIGWVKYDWQKPETRPVKYGTYFVHRKDGKTHWETWNGSGWAYNNNVITHWKQVKPPKL